MRLQGAVELYNITAAKVKMTKADAGYVFRIEAHGIYHCDQCAHFIPDARRCEQFDPIDVTRAYGACNDWTFGVPSNELTPLGVTTPEKAAYLENKPGFGCKRCYNFSLEKLDCMRVDKDSPGATPGKIIGNACCNEWRKA